MKLPAFIRDVSLSPLEYHTRLRQWSREMRDVSPIVWDDESANWLIFRYEDVTRVQNDYQTFSSENTLQNANQDGSSTSIIALDPPRHRQMRSLMTQAFSARTVAGLAPQIERIVDRLFEGIIVRDELDWMTDLANPLPVIVIANLLGLPAEEWPQFKVWTDALVNRSSGQAEANEQFTTCFSQAIDKRRNVPGTDILSLLIAAEVDGERLSYEDLLSFCFTLFIAGNITTTNVLGNAILCFEEHPAELERLRHQPELIPTAIEEILRYMPPFRAGPNDLIQGRVAKTDVSICDQAISAGEKVQLNRLSANFDERQFAEPDRFDVGRNPNHHQSFGHGIHFCLGAPLARLEIKIVLEKMLSSFQKLHLVSDQPLRQAQSSVIFGVQHLPMTFQPVRI